jgi:hypothetical protein
MSDNKLTDERGLYQLPDEPDAAPCEYCKGTRVCSVCDGRGTIQEGWGIGGMDALACGSCGGEGGCSFCEPDAAPQGSVSAPVSAMGRADAPKGPSKEALEFAPKLADVYIIDARRHKGFEYQAALVLDTFAAARVAEAVAQERARIVAALRKHLNRHKAAFDLHREAQPLIANEHNAVRWGLTKAIAIALDEEAP